MAECVNCGEPLTGPYQRKFCSKSCGSVNARSARRRPLPARACSHCGNDFEPRAANAIYCAGCRFVTRQCERCCEPFTIHRNFDHNGQRRFCSQKCMGAVGAAGKRGAENFGYVGGLTLHKAKVGGHRWIINTRTRGQVLFARAVMEAHVGRELRRDEHVHHINGDTTDDRLENLQLLSASEHSKLHWQTTRSRAA